MAESAAALRSDWPKPVRTSISISRPWEHVGLVAQDVQKVIPEAVTENSKGYLLLNNDPILWSMLNAIKEQQSQIDKQQRQIRAQHAEIKTQQVQIARLSSQVKAIQGSVNTGRQNEPEVRIAKATSTIHQ
jgi:predicted RNase H-like nuclease (RuvC/YqgF family)